MATHVESGYQWTAGLWEAPVHQDPEAPRWSVPTDDVDATVHALFTEYDVWRLYADPAYWQAWTAQWAGAFGRERVIDWWTTRFRPMTTALEGYDTAIKEGTVSHDGDPRMARHLGNCRRKDVGPADEEGKKLWLIQKERPDSPHKIDLTMAAVLSWKARTDAIAAGATKTRAYQMLVLGGAP